MRDTIILTQLRSYLEVATVVIPRGSDSLPLSRVVPGIKIDALVPSKLLLARSLTVLHEYIIREELIKEDRNKQKKEERRKIVIY